jgi:hypothetical protein
MGIGVGFVSFRSQSDTTQTLDEILKRQDARTRAWLMPRPSSETTQAAAPSERESGADSASTPAKWRQEVVVRRASEVPPPSEPIVSSPHDRLASTTPDDPNARYELARTLQTELKRVGCYDGEIDGSWGPASKRAMNAFTDRVNAALPGEEPDYILLRLVQNEKEQVCGTACPSGQTLQGNRCVALGSTVKRTQPRATTRIVEPQPAQASEAAGTPEPATPPIEGRMSVGAPPPAAAAPQVSERKPAPADRRQEGQAGSGFANAYAAPPRPANRPESSQRWTRTLWESIASRH